MRTQFLPLRSVLRMTSKLPSASVLSSVVARLPVSIIVPSTANRFARVPNDR